MEAPELWIIAGPNGAGKSTCVALEPIASLIGDVTFLNPDDRTLTKLRSLGYQGFTDAPIDLQTKLFLESANEVSADLDVAILNRQPIGIETVLSTHKYCSTVESVKRQLGTVWLVYVALNSPGISAERIAARVRRGGHGVPEAKIPERWHRSLDNLAWFACRSTAFWIVDNSDSDPGHHRRMLASGKSGILERLDETAFPELKSALSSLPGK
jgi:predicted ABC-type ATPase